MVKPALLISLIFALVPLFVSGDLASAAAPTNRAGRGAELGPNTGPRKLAPGVLKVIPPVREEDETFSGPREVVEVVHGIPKLDWNPFFTPKSNTLLEISRIAIFRRPVWHLDFAFKPLRIIEVDVPQPSGKMQRKRIWYMVYRVKNDGYHMRPMSQEDPWGHKIYVSDFINHSTRFFPHFVLESREFNKAYLDRLIPSALDDIQKREDPGTTFYNSVQISTVDVPVSTERADRSVWGVVTWEDIDPRIDFFSIYIQGLTNAYLFEDPPGAYKMGDPPGTGRRFTSKTLQMNFWRAGDALDLHEREIHYGVPSEADPVQQDRVLKAYGIQKRVDHLWIYR